MKAFKLLRMMVILGGIFLSACSGVPAGQDLSAVTSAGGDKPLSEVVFTGRIESINGSQWLINGQSIQVDSSAFQDGSFVVGDTVKVEAHVASDGSVSAQNIESPARMNPTQPATSIPDPSITETPVVSQANETELIGTVESLTDTSITVGGQLYTFAPGAEIKGAVTNGAIVKLHVLANPDGSLSVREVEIADPTQVSDDPSHDDNSITHSLNDDPSTHDINDDNSNDDHGSDDHSEDNSHNTQNSGSNHNQSDDGDNHS